MKDIFLFWIQGAGKGTQAKMILNEFWDRFSYFEAWNILRAMKSNDNAIWNYIKKIIDRWELVDDELIVTFFDAFLITLEKWQAMLVDGFPRKMWQYYMMMERFKKMKRDYVVIYLDLPEEEAIRRLSWRRICEKCGAVYNIYKDWDLKVCPKCWWKLIIRHDDKPEIIKKRIEIFKEETLPVIKEFEKQWVVYKIDASMSPNEVFDQIKKLVL